MNPHRAPSTDKPAGDRTEADRVRALRATGLLDAGDVEELAELPALAAASLGAPMAALSLLDERRQVLIGATGIGDLHETPRDVSFCDRAIAGDDLFEVTDARGDPRFRDNPLVQGGPRIGSYAGVPVATADGYRIGVLFVADHAPRTLDAAGRELLRRLARQASRIVALHTAAARLARVGRAQDAAVAALGRAVDVENLGAAFEGLLADVLAITGSAYGFIGEVHQGCDGRPFLKTHALTNIAWNDETRALYDSAAATGMEFHRLDTLFGHVMTSGHPVFADDPARDPRRGGLPPGHPPLDAFVGLPIHSRGRMVGMIGLANRPGGYTPGLARDLEPALTAMAAMIEAARAERERQAAEAALARERTAALESERRFRAALESLDQVAVQAYTPDGRITFWNRASEVLYGWRADETIGRDMVELVFPAEARDDERALLAEIARSGAVPAAGEVELARRDGSRATVYASRVLVPRDDGPPEFFCFDVDVTQRRKAEAGLALSEARLRLLNESAPHAVVVLDAETGMFVDFNGKACQLFGVDEATLRRLGPLHFSPEHQPDGRPSLPVQQQYVQRTLAGEEPVFEWMHQRADGTPVPCEIHLVRLPDPQRLLIRGNVIDISDRKAAEGALRESERRFRSLVEDIETIAVQGYDQERRITFWNRASERLYGWTAEEALGRRLEDTIIPPPMRSAIADIHGRWVREGRVDVPSEELVLADRNGMPVPVYSSHVMQRAPDGTMQMYCLDIDLRDLRRTEAALREANAALQQRNTDLQRFVMAASHDLQEPLRKVQTFGDRLEDTLAGRLSATEADYLARLQSAAARMRDLIQDLLDYSAASFGEARRQPVDLAAVLGDVLEDLGAEIAASDAQVESRGLEMVPADPMQMRQLLQNLVGNALKYRHPGRAPRIAVEGARVDAPAGPCLRVSVTDNGIGFDDAQRERIFIPFHRLHTRSEYAGTGIGLAIVRRVVERHGGSVAARGRPGEGARFDVLLPLGASGPLAS